MKWWLGDEVIQNVWVEGIKNFNSGSSALRTKSESKFTFSISIILNGSVDFCISILSQYVIHRDFVGASSSKTQVYR